MLRAFCVLCVQIGRFSWPDVGEEALIVVSRAKYVRADEAGD